MSFSTKLSRLVSLLVAFVAGFFCIFTLRYAYGRYEIYSNPEIPFSTAMIGAQGGILGIIGGITFATILYFLTRARSSTKKSLLLTSLTLLFCCVWFFGLRMVVQLFPYPPDWRQSIIPQELKKFFENVESDCNPNYQNCASTAR